MISDILYFDGEGVAGLAAQLPDAGLKSFSQQTEFEASSAGALRSKFSLGNLLQAVGLPSIGVDSEVSAGQRSKGGRTEYYEITPEQQYTKIITALSGSQKLYRNIDAARIASLANNRNVFCNISAKFKPLGDPQADEWRTSSNTSGYLVLSLEDNPRVNMGMSLAKVRGIKSNEIVNTSHLALSMRTNAGLQLSVFGRFDGKSYIKPFVVTHY
ncbi:hypothetical protein [Brevundimonas nasdae]|uniref:hypothetical protein n=1 Tax=Brevundimonas nasdae TaxID=172043 RepID=UPI0028A2A84F|nr:hypothetical protein [Brevundimonas nasdae]